MTIISQVSSITTPPLSLSLSPLHLAKIRMFYHLKVTIEPILNHFAGTLSPLSRLYNLQFLTGGRNRLTGDLKPLAKILGNLFTNLQLQGNRLQGTLEGIADLEFLMTLNVASNQLEGGLKSLLNKVKLVRHCNPLHTRRPDLFMILHNWLTDRFCLDPR